ncbi:MAG TPA: hypothetical protein VFV34_29040, partial [Blastocatellia bacterium]|nr:hypothetical protein [Blastocatellia bacterium]
AIIAGAVVLATIQPMQAGQAASAQHLAEMKKLEMMAGNWKGEGWAFARSGRVEFISSEKVERQLDGLLLVIEGLHHRKLEGGKPGEVVHHAYAVISYDPAGPGYLFDAYQLDGHHLDAKARSAGPNTFEWGFTSPQGTVRYTIKFEGDRWNEVGETSQDGTTWRKIFEMNLQRAK